MRVYKVFQLNNDRHDELDDCHITNLAILFWKTNLVLKKWPKTVVECLLLISDVSCR